VKRFVSGAVNAYFPEVKVRENPCALAECWHLAGDYAATLHLGLSQRVFHQLRNEPRFDVDPLIEIVRSLDDLAEGEFGIAQCLFQPARSAWGQEMIAFAKLIEDEDRVFPLIEREFGEPAFAVVLRVLGVAADAERSGEIARCLATTLHVVTQSKSNELTLLPDWNQDAGMEAMDIIDRETRRFGMILSLSELATLVHLPSVAVRSKRLARQSGRTKPPPAMAIGHELILGTNEHDRDSRLVSISLDQRLRHIYTIGASGTGKSTLLLSMAIQDIILGHGFAVLDPHGDLVEEILTQVSAERTQDVICSIQRTKSTRSGSIFCPRTRSVDYERLLIFDIKEEPY
jgi:hypothetical protein